MKIKVSMKSGTGKDFYTIEKEYIDKVSQEDVRKIAQACVQTMKDMIMLTSEKATGHLASLIDAEPIENGWGVGDIDKLNKESPYWDHLDKGSLGIGANWEHFLPKGFWSNGRWIVNSSGYAGIKPKTPIKAHNYIDKTLAQMEILIPGILG